MNRVSAPLACLALLAGSAAGDIVYSNTAAPLNTFHQMVPAGTAFGPERGNSITLSGVARSVTSMTVMMRIGEFGVATFNMTARLYANDGPGGSPGTRLWESSPRFCLIDSGAAIGYAFTIPGGVQVPDTVTWTVEVTGRSGMNQSPLGPAHFASPTVGSSSPGVWSHAGGVWTVLAPAEAPLGAILNACYANCDGSTVAPALNVADFTCFLQRFAAGHSYANCDQSTTAPSLNVADFTCFLQRFAAGCP